jgi:microcystin degradation protein MlrC
MRIALAEISQETDTFSPIPSGIEDFRKSTFLFGEEVLNKKIEADVLDGARVFFGDKPDVELLPVLAAKGVPSGKLTETAVEFFYTKLTEGLAVLPRFNGLFLSLHGATASDECDDVSGLLLQAARRTVGDAVPIAVVLDHHAVVTQLIMDTADIIVGFETQPHRPFDTGKNAAGLFYGMLTSRMKPEKALVKVPMIAPQDQFLTSAGPMKKWFDSARELEKQPGVLSISLFPMQPWVDVSEGGWSVVVYTEDDSVLAHSLAYALADEVWSMRAEFWVSERVAVTRAIKEAAAAPPGLVVISDTGDAVYGGGTGDSTCLIAEMIRQDIACTVFVPVVDSAAVEECRRAGLGPLKLTFGGRYDPFSEALTVRGMVAAISDGLKLDTPFGATDVGKTVLFEVGNLRIVIMETRSYPVNMPVLYTTLGLKIEDAKIVVLKTGSNFQFFDPWRKTLIRADSPGTTQSNLTEFSWRKLPRPIYPLDDMSVWKLR